MDRGDERLNCRLLCEPSGMFSSFFRVNVGEEEGNVRVGSSEAQTRARSFRGRIFFIDMVGMYTI